MWLHVEGFNWPISAWWSANVVHPFGGAGGRGDNWRVLARTAIVPHKFRFITTGRQHIGSSGIECEEHLSTQTSPLPGKEDNYSRSFFSSASVTWSMWWCVLIYITLYGQFSNIIAVVRQLKIWRWEDLISLIVKERCMQLWVILMPPLFIWLPFHQSMAVHSMHQSINNVYVLTGCAVMFIPAIICTYSHPYAFPHLWPLHSRRLLRSVVMIKRWRKACRLWQCSDQHKYWNETDLLTKIFMFVLISNKGPHIITFYICVDLYMDTSGNIMLSAFLVLSSTKIIINFFHSKQFFSLCLSIPLCVFSWRTNIQFLCVFQWTLLGCLLCFNRSREALII